VLPCVAPDDLWIAERNFCTVDFRHLSKQGKSS
jgi:hypothetical protein